MEKVIKLPARVHRIVSNNIRLCSNGQGDSGSGAGKGGGRWGPTSVAGGGFGKIKATNDEDFYNRLRRKKLILLKDGRAHEVTYLKLLIKETERALDRHRKRMEDLDNAQKF